MKGPYQSADQIEKDEEPHRETAHSAQVRKNGKLAQVVNGRVDPTPALRKQHSPGYRRHGTRNCVRSELGLEGGEMFHQQCRQESIFAEGEQILLVQGVYVIIRIFINYTVGDDERSAFVSSADAVKGEATRKTRD